MKMPDHITDDIGAISRAEIEQRREIFERLKNSHIDNFESHPEELVKRMSHGDCALFLLEILIAKRDDADAIGDIISAWILREAAYIARIELPPLYQVKEG